MILQINIIQIFIRLGYKNEIQFKEELLRLNTYTLDEIRQKSKIEILLE